MAVGPTVVPLSEAAAAEPWRANLARGDAVEVRSASAGGWLSAKVIGVSPDGSKVKVEYPVAGERCDKVLLRASPDLRPAATTVAAVGAIGAAAALAEARGADCWAIPSTPGQAWLDVSAADTVAVAPATTPPRRLPDRPLAFAPEEWVRFKDLELGELLGAGGYGAVHRSRLRGEEVAVKKLHVEGCGQLSQQQLAEFQKEVVNLQSLRHPRLIRFIGVALEPPVLCIVTELAAGGSLYALLHKRPTHAAPLNWAQRRRISLQIVEGVAYLHGRQPPRVHRDLKSANVVLDGELGAKLCDFGLTESMEKTHLSRREAEGGSPRYMSPEVFDSRKRLTEKLDIWALSCLIVEILTNRVPHEDCSTLQQVASKLLVYLIPPYEDGWASGLRPEIPQLVGPGFERDPTKRPSAASLLEGLSRLEIWAVEQWV